MIDWDLRIPMEEKISATMLALQHSSQYLQDATERRGIKDIP
jgi:hypothetical protein